MCRHSRGFPAIRRTASRLISLTRTMTRTMIQTTTSIDCVEFALAIVIALALACYAGAVRQAPVRVTVEREMVTHTFGEDRYFVQFNYWEDEHSFVSDSVEVDQATYLRLRGHSEACFDVSSRKLGVCGRP